MTLTARSSVDELLVLWKKDLLPLSRAILSPHVQRVKEAYARYKLTGNYEEIREFAYYPRFEAEKQFYRSRAERGAKRSRVFRHSQERARWGTNRKPVYQVAYRLPGKSCHHVVQLKGDQRLNLLLVKVFAATTDVQVKLLSEVKNALEKDKKTPYVRFGSGF